MPVRYTGTWCEIRLCAFVRPRVPCVPCVSRLPPVSFYRYLERSPRCLFTGTSKWTGATRRGCVYKHTVLLGRHL